MLDPLRHTLPISAHLGVFAVTLVVGLKWGRALRTWSPRAGVLISAVLAMCGVCCVALWLPAPWAGWVGGKEGVFEALTEGVLAALLCMAIRERGPWIALASLILLLEELDYGQLYVPFTVPDGWLPASSRSDALNFHNTRWSVLWRVVPLVAAVVVAQMPTREGRVRELWRRLRLPRLDAAAGPALVVSFVVGLVGLMQVHERFADEVFELLAVGVILVCWRPPLRAPCSVTRGPQRDARSG